MRFIFETLEDCFLLTPLISLVSVKCQSCDEDHGWSISIGWLFWQANFYFASQPH